MGRYFCAIGSEGAGEPLAGTAPERTWSWLGVEVPGSWAPDPLDSPGVGARLRDALTRWRRRPGRRVQLVQAPRSGPRHAWWADTRPGREALWRWPLDDDDALVADLDAPLPPERAERVTTPVVWVCTHGRRDACCARFGMETWRALAERADLPVLRTSHLGGHRFAPTLLVLPTGLMYGRVHRGDVDPLLAAIEAGRVWLERLRGRVALTRAAQAAEHAIRRNTGDTTAPLLGAASDDGASGGFRIRLSFGHADHVAEVHPRPGPRLRTSCGASDESTPVTFDVRLVHGGDPSATP